MAVVTDGFAQSAFGGPERTLGRTILLDRTPYTVIGIMPRVFFVSHSGSRFSDHPADVFVPVSWSNDDRQQNVSGFDYSMVARLEAKRYYSTGPRGGACLLKRVVEDYPPKMKQALSHTPNFSLQSQTVPFREEFTGNVERPLLLLMAAVGIVLLIGCADVANLMFSRMIGRQREFALRPRWAQAVGVLLARR